jgi:hypothetical protein
MVLESDLCYVKAVDPSHHLNQVPVLFQPHCALKQTTLTVDMHEHSTQFKYQI